MRPQDAAQAARKVRDHQEHGQRVVLSCIDSGRISYSTYSLKMTTVALPVSGMDPPLKPDATATYCLPLAS
jgi:hypothetical protein